MKSLVLLAAPLVLAILSTAAFAQPATDIAIKPISVRLGVLFPTNGTTRRFTGRAKGQLGASYALTSVGKGKFLPRLDLDYFGASRDSGFPVDSPPSTRHNRLNAYTLTLNALVPISQREGLNRGPYVGAGIGIARSHQRTPFSLPAEGAGNGPIMFGFPASSSKTGFAAKAFVGYNFTPNIFGEIGYNELPKVAIYNPSNAFVQLGARF